MISIRSRGLRTKINLQMLSLRTSPFAKQQVLLLQQALPKQPSNQLRLRQLSSRSTRVKRSMSARHAVRYSHMDKLLEAT